MERKATIFDASPGDASMSLPANDVRLLDMCPLVDVLTLMKFKVSQSDRKRHMSENDLPHRSIYGACTSSSILQNAVNNMS